MSSLSRLIDLELADGCSTDWRHVVVVAAVVMLHFCQPSQVLLCSSSLHRHRSSDGLGSQGDWNPFCWHKWPRRRLHAQEAAETQVPLWTKRQGTARLHLTSYMLQHYLAKNECSAMQLLQHIVQDKRDALSLIYRVGQKKWTPNALRITSSNIGRF